MSIDLSLASLLAFGACVLYILILLFT